MNYPRIKKVSFIVVAILVVVGALLLSTSKKPATEKADSIAISPATTTVSTATFDYKKDSDTDGLPDWEETLWGTDVTKADTDGDKTDDGAEVKLGRNPLVKGPKDKLQDAPLLGTSATTSAPLTETDKFGREIFARYMNLRQSGQSTNADSKQQLVDDLLAASESIGGAHQYTSADIKISASVTLKEYGNAIASILQNNSTKTRNEATILKEAVDKENPDTLKELDPLINGYANMLKQFLALKVTQEIADDHLVLVNSMSNIVFTAKAFRNTFTDPVVSLKSLGQYQINAVEFPAILVTIGQELSRQKITYTPVEAGYLFHLIQ